MSIETVLVLLRQSIYSYGMIDHIKLIIVDLLKISKNKTSFALQCQYRIIYNVIQFY